MRKKITILGNPPCITDDNLYKYIHKSIPVIMRIKKGIDISLLKRYTNKIQLIYHPIWLVKLLIIADRKPLPPKKSNTNIFIDAISGYRGLLNNIPLTTTEINKSTKCIDPFINEENNLEKYIQDVQNSQINRSYMLKKPKYKTTEYFLTHLPLWKVEINGSKIQRDIFLNANTGESEQYMASQWNSKKWLLSSN